MSGNRTEIYFFSSLPSLVSVTPHPSVSFSLASSVLTPRYAAAALTGSPRERGEGGSRAQSRGYPPACEGRWGYVASGAGPRAVGTEQVSFITNYSTGLAPFPRLSAPPHSPHIASSVQSTMREYYIYIPPGLAMAITSFSSSETF